MTCWCFFYKMFSKSCFDPSEPPYSRSQGWKSFPFWFHSRQIVCDEFTAHEQRHSMSLVCLMKKTCCAKNCLSGWKHKHMEGVQVKLKSFLQHFFFFLQRWNKVTVLQVTQARVIESTFTQVLNYFHSTTWWRQILYFLLHYLFN